MSRRRKPDDCREQWTAAKVHAEMMFDVGRILSEWDRTDPCWPARTRRTR